MIVPGSATALLFAAMGSQASNHSLRFCREKNNRLYRNFPSPSNRQIQTFSIWSHKTKPSGILFSVPSSGPGSEMIMAWSGNTLAVVDGARGLVLARTANAFRSFSGWYHVVFAFDTTQADPAKRLSIQVNNSWQALSVNNIALNELLPFGKADTHSVGMYAKAPANLPEERAAILDGPITSVSYVTGQKLPASAFGEIRDNKWVPKKYVGEFGYNGFYLDFSSGVVGNPLMDQLFDDYSGNSNHFTGQNFIRASGIKECWLTDHPATPYSLLDDLTGPVHTSPSVEEAIVTTGGGLEASAGGTKNYSSFSQGSEFLFLGGKHYIEMTVLKVGPPTYPGSDWPRLHLYPYRELVGKPVAVAVATVIVTAPVRPEAGVLGKTYGLAVDYDNGKAWVRNPDGTWVGGGNPALGSNPTATFVPDRTNGFLVAYNGYNGAWGSVNFGQRAYAMAAPLTFTESVTTVKQPPQKFPFSINITENKANFDLAANLLALGWDGVQAVQGTVSVAPGVAVGSSTVDVPGFTIERVPSTSSITLVNQGFIVGKGGRGGDGKQAGQAGGPALRVTVPVKVNNTGTIGGGGGGGGGQGGGVEGSGAGTVNYWYVGGGGGGGAGYELSLGGTHLGSTRDGYPGTVTAGGRGGEAATGYEIYGTGGAGGNLGTKGQDGPPAIVNRRPAGGVGGSPGTAVIGNTFITWEARGTVLGPIA